MPTFLENIDVQFISLVKKGANKRCVVYKSADDPPVSWSVPVKKTDEDKQMVYGIVYAPDDVDTQDEYTNSGEIEKAAYGFMKSLNLHNIDKAHNFLPEHAFVAESWLVRKDDPVFSTEKEGAWAVGIKVEDDDLWQEVKKGNIKALSMAGTADKHIEKATTFNTEHGLRDLWELNSALESSIRSIMEDEVVTDKKSAVITSIEEFKTAITGQLFSTTKKADESVITKLLNKMRQTPKKEEKEMKKEEVQAIIKDALVDYFKKGEEDQAAALKKAVDDGIKPVIERIEKLETASPGTKQDDEKIKKTAEEGANALFEDAKSRAGKGA